MTEIIRKLSIFLEENEDGVSRVKAAHSKEEALSILAEYGITMTAEQFEQLKENVLNDELSPEMLELVSGGGKAWIEICDFFRGFLSAFG